MGIGLNSKGIHARDFRYSRNERSDRSGINCYGVDLKIRLLLVTLPVKTPDAERRPSLHKPSDVSHFSRSRLFLHVLLIPSL